MLKRFTAILLSFIMVFCISAQTFAERSYSGETEFKENLLFINGIWIPSAQLPNLYVYIPVNALNYYGFDVTLSLQSGRCVYNISRSKSKKAAPSEYTKSAAAQTLMNETKIFEAESSVVYIENSDTPANIYETENGTVLIQSDELARFGTYFWDEQTYTISINLKPVVPEQASFSEITGLTDANGTFGGVIVSSDGKCADISNDDLKEWLQTYINFSTFDRVTAPLDISEQTYYIKFYDENSAYTVFSNSGIIAGQFGETKQNYVWYLPYVGNARMALYSADEKLRQKYLAENGEIFEGVLRDTKDTDEAFVKHENLLFTDGANQWAKDEIRRAAACNLLLMSFTDKYRENITREDFCSLIYRLIALRHSPNIDSRMGEWFAAEAIIDKSGLRESFNSVCYSDCDSDKIKFLSAAGIIYGTDDNRFMPQSHITREQAAAILMRCAEFLGYKKEADSGFLYDDKDKISYWATQDVLCARSMGIMVGVTETEFAPQSSYTVEQAVAAALRLYEYI